MLLMGLAQAAPTGAQNSASEDDFQTFRIYPTDRGDTLRGIAGRKDVLRDPLRWIFLYRLNRDELSRLKIQQSRVADTPLPAGLNIIYISPDEARKQANKKAAQRTWVVNLYSSTQERDVETLAVRLADDGYNTYISRLFSKKNTWFRLRVGFFPDHDQASEAGRKMISLLGLPKFWAVQAQLKEIQEYSGYAD
jgi:hypothetical protein